MTLEIVIRGGSIIDGTGSEPVPGDLAIKDGFITAIGKVEGKGLQEIDATGQMVTPGFIDIHTHLDAQIGWDPDMTPVSWHGVTTALIGNCGVTFAPCKPTDHELLAGMMETVEDIPKAAILNGLPWDWEEYGDYLDSIDRLGTSVNVAGLVGHCAVRFYVIGERAVEEQATEEEKRQMAEIVGRSLDRGAFGFSSNRYEPHKLPDGRSIPGTFAEPDELETIARAVGSRKGLMQTVGADADILKAMANTPGCRVLFSYGIPNEEGAGQAAAARLDELCQGRDITAISHVRGSGYLFGLQSGLPVKSGETWQKIAKLDLAGRLSAINVAETAAKLVEEARQPESTRIPMDRVFYLGLGEQPNYLLASEQNLQAEADAAGEHWSETFLRISRESKGKGLFTYRMFAANLPEQADLFKSKNIFPGLGDAGAHVSQIMDAGWASFILSYWQRETRHFTLGEAIQKMTSGPARVLGLKDRGTLAVGMRADINVFDADKVAELQPELVHDFPGGAPRYIQKSTGFKVTIINGQVSLVDGELTGVRAGKVLRYSAND